MKIALPDAAGHLTDYHLTGTPIPPARLGSNPARVVFSAAHVVADPFAPTEPTGKAATDWTATMALRRHLPESVKMYTGDDFTYPELIQGDDQGFSHGLLGIFDPLAAAAADAVTRLGAGDVAGFRAVLDPTVRWSG